MATQKVRVGLEKSAKFSFPFNTNHKKPTHSLSKAFKLWNNSLGKVVNLFWERYLKYKINNRNLCHKLEGSRLLLIIWILVHRLSIRVRTCKIVTIIKEKCFSIYNSSQIYLHTVTKARMATQKIRLGLIRRKCKALISIQHKSHGSYSQPLQCR